MSDWWPRVLQASMSSREVEPDRPGYIGLLGRSSTRIALGCNKHLELHGGRWMPPKSHVMSDILKDLYMMLLATPPKCFPILGITFYTFLFCFLCKSASSFVAWAISLKQLATRRRTDPKGTLNKNSPDSSPIQFHNAVSDHHHCGGLGRSSAISQWSSYIGRGFGGTFTKSMAPRKPGTEVQWSKSGGF